MKQFSTRSHRTVIIIFVLVAIALVTFHLKINKSPKQEIESFQSKIVKPVTQQTSETSVTEELSSSESEEEVTTFIHLLPDETLLNTLTVDLNSDMLDDQVILVRKVTSSYLYVIVGLYNSETSSYERSIELQTPVTQAHSFSFAGLDVLGDHSTELVYQGLTETGYSILRIYQIQKKFFGGHEFELIGDFTSDGSVFIQQTARNQAYELSHVDATPFSVVVYGSSPETIAAALAPKTNGTSQTAVKSDEQFQITYRWNSREKKFVESERTKMSERRISANERAKIQDGTVKTFANFLNGLWYKTSNDAGGMRYLYFDYENSEIILQYNDSEEVYSWIGSYLNQSGIYLSTKNISLANLTRRYFITLISGDEIRLRIQENIGMLIGEANLWDGNYKKMTTRSEIATSDSKITSSDFIKDFSGNSWQVSDGSTLTFKDGRYTLKSDFLEESGKYSVMDAGGVAIIAFRPQNLTNSVLNSTYQLSYGIISNKNSSRSKSSLSSVIDHNTIMMQPVKISLEQPSNVDGALLTLTRN